MGAVTATSTLTPPSMTPPLTQPLTPPLAYRRGPVINASQRSLTTAVRQRERAYQTMAWTMLILGTIALLAAPALAAGVVASVQAKLGHHVLVQSAAAFAAASLLLIPLLFWLERITRGHFLEHEMSGSTIPAPSAGLVEIFLWGPRMIFAARDRRRATAPPYILTDAAATIAYLRHFADAGVANHELPTIHPAPLIQYLASRHWIGRTPDGRRLWLLADARRALGFE
jgi:hypothetical protein